jgi:ectoine hydroxylase-related dioxygenase (phytanoyl-CoA dioxygenase family)
MDKESIMDIREALQALGVHESTLTREEKAALDHDGYLLLRDVIPPDVVERMRKRLDELLAAEGKKAGIEVEQEVGADRLSDLINKGDMFDLCFTHPRVLAGIAHVLKGEFKLSSLNFRDALPGQGNQPLHVDWRTAVAPGDFFVCNSIWLLDDYDGDNGATRCIPGSHLSGKLPQDVLLDPAATQWNEVKLVAPTGCVMIFNSHTWHGGTLNRSNRRRRGLHSYFCRRDQQQQLDQRKYIRPETRARLSPAGCYILDV